MSIGRLRTVSTITNSHLCGTFWPGNVFIQKTAPLHMSKNKFEHSWGGFDLHMMTLFWEELCGTDCLNVLKNQVTTYPTPPENVLRLTRKRHLPATKVVATQILSLEQHMELHLPKSYCSLPLLCVCFCLCVCTTVWGLLGLLVGCGAVLSVLWDICGLRDGLCGTVLWWGS